MRIGECLGFGWEIFKRHTGGLVAATFCLGVAQSVLFGVLSLALRWPFTVFANMLLSGLTLGGMMNVARIAAGGGSPTLDDAFLPYRKRQGDYLLVGLVANIGTIAFVIGALVSGFICLFAPLLVVDGDDYKHALTRSKDLMFEHFGKGVVLFGVLALINAIGVLTVIGVLVTAPVSALALLKAYEQLSVVKIFPDVARPDAPV
jgi:hypothetical protein